MLKMTKQLLFLAIFLFSLLAIGKELKIAQAGKSSYIIVIPDKAKDPKRRVSIAASLLQQGIHKSANVRLPIYFESSRPRNKKAIFLGKTQTLLNRKINLISNNEWDSILKADKGDLFLFGFDGKSNIKNFRPGVASGDGEIRGTLRAVTIFLHDYVGTRFLLPGQNGIVFTPKSNIQVASNLNRVETLKMRAYSRLCDPIYDCANNFIAFDKYKSYGGHSYYNAVPVSKYGKTHPEYFILYKGKRSPELGPASWQRNHLCISNKEVQSLMLKEIQKQFDAGYEWVQLAQTDGCKECECNNCQTLSKNHGERLWLVHRLVAEKAKQLNPNKKVVILSYGPTGNPPKSFNSFPSNVIIELSNYSSKDLNAWQKFKVPLLAYVYNWGEYHTTGFLPKRTPAFIGRQLKEMSAHNTLGIYRCGFGENFGLEGPVYYVFGQMLKNPSANPQALADEFYHYAYGPAAPHMKSFFDALYRSLELYSHLPLWPGETHWHNSSIMPRRPEILIPAIFTPPLLRKMRTSLTQAFRSAPLKDNGIQARLRLVQREFDYMWSVVKIYSLYRAGLMADDSMVLFDLMATEIRKHRAMVHSWYATSVKMKPFYNWPVIFANVPKEKLLAGGNMSGVFTAPFTWDLDGVRKGRIAYRNKKTATMKAIFLKDTTNILSIPRQETLNTIDGSKLKNKTLFAAGYDNKNLYFVLECDWQEAGKIKITPTQSPWNQESADILICTSRAKDKYYHFIFNPVAKSFYLARFGFITNALDPGYGKYEKINSPWEYSAWIDAQKKKWYAKVKIPFTTLGVKLPSKKKRWTINISRFNFNNNKKSQFSIWSQIPGEPAFKNPAAFGELIFE